MAETKKKISARNVTRSMASRRGLALFSGGLDSILAVKLLQEQGLEITGLTFVSYFFDSKLAEKAAKQLDIELKVVDISEELLEIVKKPRFGFGKSINPCIDCHILMLRKAKEYSETQGCVFSGVDSPTGEASGPALDAGEPFPAAKNLAGVFRVAENTSLRFAFIVTGEVLGERPMSQNRQSLGLIERESGLKGYLLRPLSAKLLEPTIPEKEGWVDREKLLDISGRSRKRQIELAKEWGIEEYPAPAGGCLLTDLAFGQRFREMLKHWPDCEGDDVQLLKLGRHFWSGDNLIIVGRNKEENEKIRKSSIKGDVLIEPEKFPGPTVLIRGKTELSKKIFQEAKELMIKYSPKMKK